MSDISLSSITSAYNLAKINDNFAKIQNILNTDRLALTDKTNTMSQDLDMNGYRLLNTTLGELIAPTHPGDAVRLVDLLGEAAIRDATDTILQNQLTNLIINQNSGTVGYATLALMNADLSKPDGTVAYVTNDPTVGNNTTYRKSGAAGTGSWVMAIDRITNLTTSLSSSTGSTGVGFLQVGTGAITRSVSDRLKDTISVKDYGAKGDGVTDDSAAFQLAMNTVGLLEASLFIPSGTYILNSTIILPLANITVFGNRGSSVITGAAATFFKYPTATKDGSGNVKIQHISNLKFILPADNVGIDLTQTWDGGGKAGPSITSCDFIHTSATTTTATSILIKGMWSGLISGCFFLGRGNGGGPTNGIGGYAIRGVLGDDPNTSIMNLTISNNIVVTIANPVRFEARTLQAGGRVEGIRVINNNFIAGFIGIYTNQTNNTGIIGNQIDDFYVAVKGEGDFDYVANTNLLNGSGTCLNLVASVNSITERWVISGNKMNCGPDGVGIRLTNTIMTEGLRSGTIVGNSINAQSLSTAHGLSFEGSFSTAGITITGNSFQQLLYGLWFSPLAHQVKLTANSYNNVTNIYFNVASINSNLSNSYSLTGVYSLAGGASSETINITLPAGYFYSKPDNVVCTSTVDDLIGFYDWDNSTPSTARIILKTRSGSNITSGSHRLTLTATGIVN